MRMIVVDDEQGALSLLREVIEEAEPSAELMCFRTSEEAIQYARQHRVDVAFLDVEMPKINGL